MRNIIYTTILILIAGKCFSQDSYSNAQVVHSAIMDEGRILNKMDGSVPTDLPVGMVNNVGGQEYVVGIDSIVLSPDGSYMSATSMVEVPVTGDMLAFSGSKIAITSNGIKGASVARLNLAVDIPIRLSNKLKLTVKGSERKTYVEFDCNGFTGMGVQGQFEFCRDFLIPVLPNGSVAPEPTRVQAQFECQMSDWNNILAKVSITPFQVPELPGFDFYVQDAWVDQSDVTNPIQMVFPKDYKNNEIADNNMNLWKGFYLKQLSVKLPKQFESKKSNDRVELLLNNAIIDNMGFSGLVTAKNILPDGAMADWPFTVDDISVQLTCNKLSGAGFKGKIKLPIAKKEQYLDYAAMIQSGGYYDFNVRPKDSLVVPMWGANMILYSSSYLEITYANGKFIPKANLNGNISVSADPGNDGEKSSFKGILFENLLITSNKPYITSGTFSIVSTGKNNNDDNKLAGFAVTINDIGIVKRESENLVGLHFALAVHLMKDSDGGFSGQTGLTVFGKYAGLSGKELEFDHVEVNRVVIDVSGSAYSLHGELDVFRKDVTYGNGFKGFVDAKFQPGIEVRATGQFGNINGLRYWYVDAMVAIPNGISIAPGFGLYGFGGGLYHHMRRSDLNNPTLDNAPVASATQGDSKQVAQVQTVQPPPSGVRYIPDENTFLGLKATVIAGTYPTPDAFNADATFEIAFNDHAGVNYVAFNGTGYFMTSIANRGKNPPIKADVGISMDFVNEVLHGNFDVFVNVDGVIHGIHPNYLAGGAVMHFEKKAWYIHIGTPDNRLGLDFLGMFKATSYFMVGTDIPGMPPPPQNVTDILGGIDLNLMRDENALGKGSGFCFGASLDVNTGKRTFLIFYGQFQAGAGFDIMLKNYGNDVQCAGRGPLGVNGWYASGQAYAYLQGEVGLHVDLFFVKGDFKVLEIGAAAVLQAKLPNPTFLRGDVGGYYNILNGLVKGHCRFEVTLGEECQIVGGGSVVSNMKIISELSPKAGDSKVNVFNNPQAAFNMSLDKSFDLEDLDGTVKSFRVRLKQFKVYNGSNEIPGLLDWNESNDVVAFKPADILPGNSAVKASVTVYFEQKTNGTPWEQVVVNGKPVEETQEVSFNTGDAPDFIPLSNVKYSYPEISQYNFLKSEYGNGYIKLIKGQDYLFEADDKWIRKVRFIKTGDQSGLESVLSYSSGDNTISFTIPQSLQNNSVYNLILVNIPASKAQKVDANVNTVTTSLAGDDNGAMATTDKKTINGTLDVMEEKMFYQASLRTSKYSSFTEKMKAINISAGWTTPLLDYMGINQLGVTITGDETFDKFEIEGSSNTDKLIQFEAILSNKWYNKKVYPLLYENYPINGNISISWRSTVDLGLPPVKAISINQIPDDKILTEAEANTGNVNGLPIYSTITYNLPIVMYRDYLDLQQKCSPMFTTTAAIPSPVWNLLMSPFPVVDSGDYDIQASYIIPGINKVTSIFKIEIKNQ